ncbi:hypothetical protein [Micromonospora endophytica]|uniref:hypothetical protein n=1 Tax=Micromonospora endophytica TaxID=515350 RepID=UPI0015E89EF7|nr:hypothetical protein [Micromonospora endophytica]BCJ62718.1 hypothetical protein Jiend_61400 [Micromonospora endophytica]
MLQPDDATEALPTHRLPVDQTAEPTVRLGEPTVHLGDVQPTVRRDDVEPTGVSITGGARTGAGPAAGSVSTAGSGDTLRFGPGVPAVAPPAPAWPTPNPAPPRRRPAWRRFVSVLSTLLTLVLVAAVGLWIWQRLSPLEITEVRVAVPSPAGARCDVTVDVVATVRTNGRAGTIEYQWLRSGSTPGTLLDERIGWGQRSAELTLRWSFSGVGTTTETATVNIVAPAPMQASTEVIYSCPS